MSLGLGVCGHSLLAQYPIGAENLAAATVVVYNGRDPLSTELALFYAKTRGIPREQVIELRTSKDESIFRDDYDKQIAEPLRKAFAERGLWAVASGDEARLTSTRIRFVALIRGIPLKILPTEFYKGDKAEGPEPLRQHNEASVDSELAALGFFSRQITGALVNPYYRSFRPVLEDTQSPVLLVTRLDGPNELMVRRMITDSSSVEEYGLLGRAYIDMRGIKEPGLKEGDDWLAGAGRSLRRLGCLVMEDRRGARFPANFPMQDAAFYFGWYSARAEGPFIRPEFRFLPGAVAAHIHSFSASSVRLPEEGWVAPLIAAGASATFGNVFEPYLQFTTEIDVFTERLAQGMTFAEAAYSGTRVLSWMNTFVGDPLYRPAAALVDIATEGRRPGSDPAWLDVRRGAQMWSGESPQHAVDFLEKAAERRRSGLPLEALASFYIENDEVEKAQRYLRRARAFYGDLRDVGRLIWWEAEAHRLHGRRGRALELIDEYLLRDPTSNVAQWLQEYRLSIQPGSR